MSGYSLKHYAHLGDAVYELFVREYVVERTHSQKQMHDMTTSFVNASFQAQMLEALTCEFSEDENEIIRRAKNLPLTVNKRNNQNIHRAATAFEVIIGYLYKNEPRKLEEIFMKIREKFNLIDL